MGKTRSRRRDNLITIASGDKALTFYHRCSYTLTLLHLVGFTFLCFLPLRKLPLALFAVIVFPYLRDEEAGKGFYNGLWKFNFTGRFIRLLFWQRHFPFPKRRTMPTGGRNRERVSCSSQPGAGYQFTPRMARMSLFSRRLFMYSSRQAWGQPFSS